MTKKISGPIRQATYKSRRLRAYLRRDDGASLIEVAIIMPVLLLLLVGAVDFGQAYYAAIEVSSAAEAGALYGVQQPTDTAGMQAAAILDAPDVATIAAVATYGCQCSDGTGVSANCSYAPTNCSSNIVNYVQVSTTATYTSILRFPGIPIHIPLTSVVRMRSAH
ncbi:Flp pilus assembly protein TadG [Granulicella rosea]|uniref:Flp pilus assembly protein TadG n=1 Tax=Granulicella rosea TaxID=474952 RepID=A0A239IJP8_9BACT|nr:TadE/TadG family type IV pilus assembly protein [Granulicella rosea]SNS93986.1 Flp pilus assembly protein TadG [Granulicella rosea]